MPDFMSGLVDGINKSKKVVTKAVKGAANAIHLTVNSSINLDFDGITSTMKDGSSAGTVINNYNNDNSRIVNQTNHSPKSLLRLESYRQTRNLLKV